MENNRKSRQHAIIVVACILFSIAFLFTIWLRNAREFPDIEESSCYIIEWVLESPSGVQMDVMLPMKLDLKEEGTYSITAQMPEYTDSGTAGLLIRMDTLSYQVYVDGNLMGQYKSDFMIRHIDLIRIADEYKGMLQITFTVDSKTGSSVVLYPVSIGKADEIYAAILRANLPILFFYLLLSLAGGCSILLYLFLGRRKTIKMLLLAGLFAFTAACYGLSSNVFVKLSTQNAYFIYSVQFLSQLLLPAIIARILLEKNEGIFRKGMNIFFYLICGNAIVQVLWYILFNSMTSYTRVMITLFYHGVFILQLCYFIVGSKKKVVRSSILMFGGWLWDISADGVFLLFPERFFSIAGMVAYIVWQMQDVIREVRGVRLEMYQTNLYRTLAYTDYLTKANNRNALIEDMTYYNITPGKCVWCVFIDLNNLKEINDNNGHMYGDQIIQEMAEVLKSEFESCGKVYRIGGDEFIILVSDQEHSFMEEKITRLKEHREKDISFAIGYDRLKEKESLESLIARADQLMYWDKKYDKSQL